MSEFNTAPAPETTEAPAPEKDKKESVVSILFDYLEILVFSVCAVLIVFTVFCRLCRVDGSSMRNTLFNGENLITTNLVKPEVGDIIVFHQTSERYPNLNEPLVKRIIATEGQTVRIDYAKGEVYVDGVLQEDPHCLCWTDPAKISAVGPSPRATALTTPRGSSRRPSPRAATLSWVITATTLWTAAPARSALWTPAVYWAR